MNNHEYLDSMKKIQASFLEFLENDIDTEEKFQNLIIIFNNIKIREDKNMLKSLIHLNSKIVNNYHRSPNFFSKIEQILLFFKNDIKKYYSNSEIFNIFKKNKRILLFLIEEEIITMDEYIFKIITTNKFIELKYPHYFLPEIKPFIHEEIEKYLEQKSSGQENFENEEEEEAQEEEKNDDSSYSSNGDLSDGSGAENIDDFSDVDFDKINNDDNSKNDIEKKEWIKEICEQNIENFNEKRKAGENDDEISTYIQKDLIKEFITFINRNNYSLNSFINPSIFETNSFLLKQNNISLIEYAAFFGSNQIFNHLYNNKVTLAPSLWLYAIHGNNSEILHILEDNIIKLSNELYDKCLDESIKCHHNDLYNYIQNNLQNFKSKNISYIKNRNSKTKEKMNPHNCFIQSIKHYNFQFIQNEQINQSSFYEFCLYDYYYFVELLLKRGNIDVNNLIILTDYLI